MLIAQKYGIKREEGIERVREITGVSLHEPGSGERILQALAALENFKQHGLGPPND